MSESEPPALTPDQVSGKTFRRYNLAALLLGVVAIGVGAPWALAQQAAGPAVHDPLGFAQHPRWSDGKAEVARYAAVRTIYGGEREFELIRIAVREPYDPARRVKPDTSRPGAVDAIKTVAVHEVPSGKPYAYRQQVICRVAQADPRHLFDATSSSQEWCGSTFSLLVRRGAGFEREAHCYFDGLGDWTDRVRGDALVEDQLPFVVRGLSPDTTLTLQVLPSILTNKAAPTRPVEATLSCRERGVEKTVPACTFRCAHWVLEVAGAERHFWVAEDDTRPLVAFDDGITRGELRSVERDAYWQ